MNLRKMWAVVSAFSLLIAVGVGCQKMAGSPSAPSSAAVVKAAAVTPVLTPGCALSFGFWKTHNQFASNPALQIPWPVCGQDPLGENTLLCNMTWLSILQTPPSGGNAWTTLAQQWIAAELNVCNGTTASPDILNDLSQAQSILTANCALIDASSATGQQAVSIASVLNTFNNTPCATVTATPTATPTFCESCPIATPTPTPTFCESCPIATDTPTDTPTDSPTDTPTDTPTPTP